MRNRGVILQGVDVLDLVKLAKRKNKKTQATVLSNLERIVDPNSDDYTKIRKLFLDAMNDYERIIIKTVFGDIEE